MRYVPEPEWIRISGKRFNMLLIWSNRKRNNSQATTKKSAVVTNPENETFNRSAIFRWYFLNLIPMEIKKDAEMMRIKAPLYIHGPVAIRSMINHIRSGLNLRKKLINIVKKEEKKRVFRRIWEVSFSIILSMLNSRCPAGPMKIRLDMKMPAKIK